MYPLKPVTSINDALFADLSSPFAGHFQSPATNATTVTRTVTTGTDSGAGSLRATLTTANAGDTIVFAAAVSQVMLASTLTSTVSLTLDGASGRGAAADVVLAGSATLLVAADATIGNLTLGGSAVLRNTAALTQSANLTIGDSQASSARMTNAAGATWTLNDTSITAGAATATFNNGGGTLRKTGTGSGVIGVNVTNLSGLMATIDVAAGSLRFDGALNDFTNETIQGAGVVTMGHGTSIWASSTVLGVKYLTFAEYDSTVRVTGDLTVSSFIYMAGTIDVGASRLNLAGGGITSRATRFIGSGTVILTTTPNGGYSFGAPTTIGGSVLVRNNSSNLVQQSTLVIGDATGGAAKLTNAAQAYYGFQPIGDISISAGNTLATFNNGGGTIVKYFKYKISINVNFVNQSGLVGKIKLYDGSLEFSGAQNDFSNETISVEAGVSMPSPRVFALTGGSSTIGAGTTITTDSFDISGGGTRMTLNADLGYANGFRDTGGTVIDPGNHLFSLAAASFSADGSGAPTIRGSGKVIASGAVSIGGLTVGGSVLFRANGTVTQTGAATLGDSTGGGAQITIGANQRWLLAGDVGIASAAADTFINIGGGALVKSASTGTRSVVSPNIGNLSSTQASVVVQAGRLELGGTVSGNIRLFVDTDTTLILDKAVGKDVTVAMIGSNSTLRFNDATEFVGQIVGLASLSTGLQLDLRSIANDAQHPASLSYMPGLQNTEPGTLTVSNGAQTANLRLQTNGNALDASKFHLVSDGVGGSLVTYT